MSTTTPNDSAASHATARVITPPGQAGIAVIQLAGADALRIIRDLLESKNFSDHHPPNEDQLYFGRFLDGPQVIDDVIVACRRTHQDAWRIEINCHGGLRVIERILTALAMRGAKVVRDAQSVDLAWAGDSRFEKQVLELAIRMPTRRLATWILHQRTALPQP